MRRGPLNMDITLNFVPCFTKGKEKRNGDIYLNREIAKWPPSPHLHTFLNDTTTRAILKGHLIRSLQKCIKFVYCYVDN